MDREVEGVEGIVGMAGEGIGAEGGVVAEGGAAGVDEVVADSITFLPDLTRKRVWPDVKRGLLKWTAKQAITI